jgi:hypothetical protein
MPGMRRTYLSDFNSPAPREVPISVRIRVLFGGFTNQFGWIFFGFGLIFVWVFTAHSDIASIVLFRLKTDITIGIVESVQYTNAGEDNEPIFEVKYTYIDNLGKQHRGASYTKGQPQETARVTVEYVSTLPSFSRVVGMRREMFSPWAIIIIIFPLIGLGFIYSGMKYGIKANRLLSQGRITFGKLISTEPTGASINNRPVLKLTFTFTTDSGLDWEAVAKTHEPEDLRDEADEPLLYDPNDPSTAVLLDDLPGSAEFDANGKLVPASVLGTVRILIIPVLTVVGHGIYLLMAIFRPI